MLRMYVLPFIVFVVSLAVSAQEDPRQQLSHAFQLDWQGEFTQVIEIAQPLTTTETLTRLERGRSWMVLAHAYQQEGRFQDATTAYEQSLHLLENDKADYAGALNAFATLYRDMGQYQAAVRMQEKALHLYERDDNHGAAAVTCESLADLKLSQKHVTEGRRYLARALKEATRTTDLDNDYFATLSSTQAWLAELDGNATAAISGYQRSLALLRQLHGEQHHLVGWSLMRLGKAYAEAGDLRNASDNMSKGLSILGQTAGRYSATYLVAELAYAQVLDASGEHSQALSLRHQAESLLNNLYGNQCADCRISVAALALR